MNVDQGRPFFQSKVRSEPDWRVGQRSEGRCQKSKIEARRRTQQLRAKVIGYRGENAGAEAGEYRSGTRDALQASVILWRWYRLGLSC
jgi:hypothetical protein